MNTLNYSFRYLANRRGNTLARFVSLTLGLFVAIIIFVHIGYYQSYDRWIPDNKRIYTLGTSSNDEPNIDCRVRYPMYEQIVSENPLFEAATVTEWYHRNIQYENREPIKMQLGEVSDTFFDVFDLKIISGDPHKILSTPNMAMISDSAAEILFGDEDPLGKTIKMRTVDDDEVAKEYTIQGVYSSWDSKPTHISILSGTDLLTGFSPKDHALYHPELKWQLAFETFVKCRKGAKRVDIEKNLEGIAKRADAPEKYLKRETDYKTKYHLVPIGEIDRDDTNSLMSALLLGIGILALVVACLNYVLLSISSLAERSRTIAMLRCHGAQKRDVFKLFFAETLLIIGAAALWALFMIWGLEKEIMTILRLNAQAVFAINLMWIPIVVCGFAFLLAGGIPAWLFSQVKLETAFRGSSDNYRFWKRALLFVQMACTVAVLIFMIICIRQMQFRRNLDYGYRVKNIYAVNIHSPRDEKGRINLDHKIPSREITTSEVEKFPFVEAVSITNQNPVTSSTTQSLLRTADEQEKPLFHYIDLMWLPGFAEFLGVELVDGRYLTEEDGMDKCLVNELLVERMGWEDSAIGKYVGAWLGTHQVVGVVKDFMSAVQGTVVPTVIHKPFERSISIAYTVTMLFSEKATSEEREQVLSKLKSVTGNEELKMYSYEELVENSLSTVKAMRNIVTFVCVLVLIIALSGLIGYMDNEMQRRRKEIAIRKVAGATVKEVMLMVAADLLWITIPATAFGIAISYLAGSAWIQTIAGLRAPLSWWIFAVGALLVLTVVYVIQVARTWHTATANPIDMIKTE